MIRTDAHIHFFSHRFFSLLGADSVPGFTMPPADPAELAAHWIAELDRHQVPRAAIIASHPADLDSVFAARDAFPDRFVAAGMINPAASNLDSASRLDLLCLFPALHNFSLSDPRTLELLAAARRPVFIHCGRLSIGVRAKLGLPAEFNSPEAHPDRVRPLAERFPDLPFLLPHFGAGLFDEALALAAACPNVHFDTSSTNSWIAAAGLTLAHVFARSLDVLGPTRLLFGTDSSFFPRGWHRAVFDQQLAALEQAQVSLADQQLIFHGNFARIFAEKNRP